MIVVLFANTDFRLLTFLQAQNRMSYNCSRCNSTFNDLEVDRLFNTDTGGLRYPH